MKKKQIQDLVHTIGGDLTTNGKRVVFNDTNHNFDDIEELEKKLNIILKHLHIKAKYSHHFSEEDYGGFAFDIAKNK